MLTIVVLATFVVGILSGPVAWSGETCALAKDCPASAKFAYAAGHIYKYRYAAVMRTSIPGSTVADVATMRVVADVNIHVLSACDFVATLTGVKIMDGAVAGGKAAAGGAKFAAALEAFPIRFAYVNGKVAHVCPAAADPVWAVNMKRGILSSLQNTMVALTDDHRAVEVDVTGSCPVSYEVIGAGRIRKVKDILACEGRHSINSAIKGMSYASQSSIKSLPVMKTGHHCVQTIAGGVIAEVKCSEIHVFRPFSADMSGAITEIDSTMSLAGKSAGTMAAPAWARRNSMLYEHAAVTAAAGGAVVAVEAIKNTIAEMCGHYEVVARTPVIFARLVEQLRAVGPDALFAMATENICPGSEIIVKDALAVVGTEASVKAIVKLVIGGRIAGIEMTVLVSSLALISNPTPAMVEALVPLAVAMPTSRVMIGAAALINNFCSQSAMVECSGKHHAIIKPVIVAIVATLGPDCSAAGADVVFTSIKALTNIGHAAAEATPVLTACAWNAALPMKIRVAAIRAFGRFPCAAIKASGIAEVMKDIRSDAELRIAAYSVLMICPDARIIDQVHTMLKGEETNQVGSYIWTHLTNLKESSSKMSSVARDLLANVDLAKSFDMDKRKFSRNVEWSAYHGAANVGGRIEADIIFSSKSFIPRSAMIALDADIFGSNIEIFKLDGRLEGMEEVLQAMLAPETMATGNNMIGTGGAGGAAASAIEKATASWEVKMLGNTFGFGEVTGKDIGAIKAKFNFIEILMTMAEHQKVDILKNVKFIDSSFVIPTMVGLPLRMRVEGVISVSMALDGKVDLRQMLVKPRSLDIKGIITPSAAVNIKAMMTLDAEFTRTGLQLDVTLHTSTSTQARVEIKEGEVFSMDLALPKQKTNLLSLATTINIVKDNRIVASATPAIAEADLMAIDYCLPSGIIGIESCVEIMMPKPFANPKGAWFPFSGPAKINVFINKIDTIRSYHVEVRHIPTAASGIQVFKAIVSTPGGATDREWSAVCAINAGRGMVKVDVHTPFISMNVNALFMNTAARKRIQIEAKTSTGITYVIYADTPISITGSGSMLMKPVVKVVWGNAPIATLDGSIEALAGAKLIAKLRLRNLTPVPIIALVSLVNEKGAWKTDFAVQCSLVAAKISGVLTKAAPSTDGIVQNLRLAGEVTLAGAAARSFVLENAVIARHTDARQHFIINSRWTTDVFANKYDGKAQMEIAFTKTQCMVNFHAGFDKLRSVSYNQVLVWSMHPAALKKTFGGKFKLAAPFWKIDYAGEVQQVFVNGRMLTVKALWNTGVTQYLAKAAVDIKNIAPLRLIVSGSVRFPGRDIMFTTSIAQVSATSFKQIGSIVLSPEMTIKFTSTLDTKLGKHLFVTKIETSEMAPWTVKVGLVTVLPKLAVEVSAIYGDVVVYGIVGKLANKGASWANFDRSVEIDLITPGRHFTAEIGMSAVNAVVAAVWEARWSPVGIVSVRAKIVAAVPMIDVTVLVAGASVNVKAAVKGTMVRAIVATSIAGWERHEINALYKVIGRGEMVVKGDVVSTLMPGKVTYEAAFKAAAGQTWVTVTVATPYVGWSVNTVSLTWMKELTGMWVIKAECNVAGMLVVANTEFKNVAGSFVAKARLTTPWAWAKAISAVVEHTITGNAANALVEVTFAEMEAFRVRIATKVGATLAEFLAVKISADVPWTRMHRFQIGVSNKVAGAAISTIAEILYMDKNVVAISSEIKMANDYYGVGEFSHDLTVRIIGITPIVWAVFYKKTAAEFVYVISLDYGKTWLLDTRFVRIGAIWKSFAMDIVVVTPMSFLLRHKYTGTVTLASKFESKVDVVAEMTPGGIFKVSGILWAGPVAWKLTGVVTTPMFERLTLSAEVASRTVAISVMSVSRAWIVTCKIDAERGIVGTTADILVVTPMPHLTRLAVKWAHAARAGVLDLDLSVMADSPAFALRGAGIVWKLKVAGLAAVDSHMIIALAAGREVVVASAWSLGFTATSVKFDIATPFTPARAVVAWVVYNKLPAGIALRTVCSVNGKAVTADISASAAAAGAKKAVAVKITSPSVHLPTLELIASVETLIGTTEVIWRAIWSPTGKIASVTRFAMTGERVFIAHTVTTPWVLAKVANVEFAMSGPLHACTVDAKLEHNLLAAAAVFHADVTTGATGNFEVNINARTPLAIARTLDIVLKNVAVGGSRYQLMVELRLPGYTGSIVNEMLINGRAHFETKTVLRYALYADVKSLTFTTALRYMPASVMVAKVAVISSWAPIAHISLAVDHAQMGPAVFKSSAKLVYGKLAVVNAEFALSPARLVLALERVHAAMAPLYVRVSHTFVGAGLFKTFIAAQWIAAEKWAIVAEKGDRAGQMVLKADVATPIAAWKEIHLSIVHKRVGGVINCVMAVIVPAGTYQIAADIITVAPEVRIVLVGATPHAAVRTCRLEMVHMMKPGAPIVDSIVFALNGKVLTAKSTFSMIDGAIVAKIVTTLPETYSASFAHSPAATTGAFKTSGDVSVHGFPAVSVSVNKAGAWGSAYDTSASVTVGPATWGVASAFSGPSSDTVRKVTVVVPESVGSIKAGEYSAHLKRSSGLGTEDSISISTPYSSNGKYNVNLKTRSTGSGVVRSIAVTTPLVNYESWAASLAHEGTPSNLKSKISIRTPIAAISSVSGTIDHTMSASMDSVSSRVTGGVNGMMVEVAVNIVLTGNTKAMLSIRTPWAFLAEASLACAHTSIPTKQGTVAVTRNHAEVFKVIYNVVSVSETIFELAIPTVVVAKWDVNFASAARQTADIAVTYWIAGGATRLVKVAAVVAAGPGGLGKDIVAVITTHGRVVKAKLAFVAGPAAFTNTVWLSWAEGKASRIAYNLAISRAVTRRAEIIFKGMLTVEVGVITRAISVVHRVIPARAHTTEIRVIAGAGAAAKSWVVINALRLFPTTFTNVFTIAHPSLARANMISVAGKNDGARASLVVEAAWAKAEKFVFSAALTKIMKADFVMDLMFNVRVEHPTSKLDAMFEVDCVNSAEKLSVGWVGKYTMMATGVIKVVSYRTTVNKIVPGLIWAVNYPGAVILIDIRKMATAADMIVFNVAATVMDSTLTAVVKVDLAARALAVVVTYPQGIVVKFVASSPNMANINVEITRKMVAGAAWVRMVNVGLVVDASNKLRINSFVRPGIAVELRKFWTVVYVKDRMMIAAKVAIAAMVKDITLRGMTVSEISVPLVSAIGAGVKSIGADAAIIGVSVGKAFERNEFFSKDIVASLTTGSGAVKSAVVKSVKSIGVAAIAAKVAMVKAAGVVGRAATGAVVGTGKLFGDLVALTADLIAWTGEVIAYFAPMMKAMNDRAMECCRFIAGKVVGIWTAWLNNPTVNSIARVVLSVDWHKTLVMPVWGVVSSVHRGVTAVMDACVGLWSRVTGVMSAFVQLPVIRFSFGMATNVVAKIVAVCDMFSVRENLWHYTWAATREVIVVFFESVANVLSVGQSGWTGFNARTGSSEFTLFMPFKLADFASLPRVSGAFFTRIAALKDNVMGPLSSSEWSVSDAFYTYKPNHDISKWLPPFAAKAMILGDSQYTTFDGRYFEFAGECSYLLTADVTGLFKVFVNYGMRGARKSISVVSGRSTVEVTREGKVIVKGVGQVELPAVVGDITVRRDANTITVVSGKGIKVECELVHNWCSVEVNGWKYGKTIGMLGTYDNEPATDMIIRSAIGASAIAGEHFAHSWSVGRCVSRANYATVRTTIAPVSATAMCGAYFSMAADAHFRRCTRVVSPAPFMTMCVKKVSYSMVPTERDICAIASIYKLRCRDAGVPVVLPAACSKCSKSSGYIASGASKTISIATGSVPRQADVIFVVEHAPCNLKVRENLGALVTEMTAALTKRGISDVVFGVVGFGGVGINGQVHAKTINGKLTASGAELIAAAATWDMTSGPSGAADTMSAVEFAANVFHFRIGAGKSVVVLACSACHEMATTFTDVRRAVIAQDIRVSVVAPGNVRLAKKSAFAPYIMGGDKYALFTHKYLTTQTGNRVLRAAAIMPRDLCVALAMESEGAYFNSLHLNNDRRQAKSFVAVVAQVLAKKSVPLACQVCTCITTSIGTGQSVCRSCDRPASSIFTYQPSYM